jgi:hypothetical protein
MWSEWTTGDVYSLRKSYLSLNGAYLLTYNMPEVRCSSAAWRGQPGLAVPSRRAWAAATAGVEQHRGHGWCIVIELTERSLDNLANLDWIDKALPYRLSSTSRTSFHEHLSLQFRLPLPHLHIILPRTSQPVVCRSRTIT